MSLESIPENSTPIPLAMEAEEIEIAAPIQPECPGESVSLEPIPKNNAPIPLAIETVHIDIAAPMQPECPGESVSLEPIPKNNAPIPLAMESVQIVQPECSRHPDLYDIREVRFCHCRGSNTVEVQHAICCSIIGGTILLIYLILTAVF